MSSDWISQTAQGAGLSIISNVLAQVISMVKEGALRFPDLVQIVQFAAFSLISNPPNIWWQTLLEDTFPNHPTPPQSEKANGKPSQPKKTPLSTRNVFIKFLLDQTIGAVVNTLMFLIYTGWLKAGSAGRQGSGSPVVQEVSEKFWPLIMDGYKIWPLYSICSFLFVPVHKRVVFGCLFGVIWGIYLSLVASK